MFSSTDNMKSTNLTTEVREVIVFLHKEGYSIRKIAEKVDKPKTTVHQTIKRHIETGSTVDRPRSGRPKVSTPEMTRFS